MRNFSDISAVILAGGKGTRLRSIIPDRPKALVEIRGRPFLTFLLDQLVSSNALNVVLCTGYMADEVHERLGDTYKSLKLIYSKEQKPLGTGGALRLALPYLNSDPVLVMNGDSYINADLNSYVDWFFLKDRKAALLLTRVPDTDRFGIVKVDKDENILSFKEKEMDQRIGWINAGVYLLRKSTLKSIRPRKAFSLELDFFPSLVGKGLYGYRCEARFLDIGTPQSYSKVDAFFSNV